jgi:hypothetical protein
MATITAKDGKEGAAVAVEYEISEDLAGLEAAFGAEVIANRASASIIVALQGYMRSLQRQGKTAKEIQAAVNEWKPGIKARGKSPQEKLMDQFAGLDPDARKALLKELAGA